ncbi:hypothetical protein [Croceicoccus sp. BE223]|uniref:hypothetical protein n=1 Tax=Croceicoccus sp. BE223 TaxID=2817716 RepID=UPI0028648D60|nr:hypothetical protein [Croceicoccus sp. BE223]MDR7102308.1 hypothetical protein [Croceicoccus sp. BE223]
MDFALPRGDYMARWPTSFFDLHTNHTRAKVYSGIPRVRPLPKVSGPLPLGVKALLDRCAAYDLQHAEMQDFVAFEFLYARLFGAAVRPFLPAAYMAAASSARLPLTTQRAAMGGIAMHEQIADTFDPEEPSFFPEWDGD